MYSVSYSKMADKALRKLDKSTAAILFGWIDKNLEGCTDPRIYGKPLVGNQKGFWRYRVGAYRIIADIQDDIVVIEIINVAHRREVYE